MTAIARSGVRGTGFALPHKDKIQRAFGHHNLAGVRTFIGGQARSAAAALGAEAYATRDTIAFQRYPTLFTAAH